MTVAVRHNGVTVRGTNLDLLGSGASGPHQLTLSACSRVNSPRSGAEKVVREVGPLPVGFKSCVENLGDLLVNFYVHSADQAEVDEVLSCLNDLGLAAPECDNYLTAHWGFTHSGGDRVFVVLRKIEVTLTAAGHLSVKTQIGPFHYLPQGQSLPDLGPGELPAGYERQPLVPLRQTKRMVIGRVHDLGHPKS